MWDPDYIKGCGVQRRRPEELILIDLGEEWCAGSDRTKMLDLMFRNLQAGGGEYLNSGPNTHTNEITQGLLFVPLPPASSQALT